MSLKTCIHSTFWVFLLALAFHGCKGQEGPKNQGSPPPNKGAVQLSKSDVESLSKRVHEYCQAFQDQDFETMWSLVDQKSKDEVGLNDFIKSNRGDSINMFLGRTIESIQASDKRTANVHVALLVQFSQALFPEAFQTKMTLEYTWLKSQEDGQWYLKLKQYTPEEMQEFTNLSGVGVTRKPSSR